MPKELSGQNFKKVLQLADTYKRHWKNIKSNFLYEEVSEFKHPYWLTNPSMLGYFLRYFLSNLVHYSLGVADFSEICLAQVISEMVQISDYKKL